MISTNVQEIRSTYNTSDNLDYYIGEDEEEEENAQEQRQGTQDSESDSGVGTVTFTTPCRSNKEPVYCKLMYCML